MIDTEKYAGISEAASKATAAYQDAARGLDTLKEIVLIRMGLVNTSKVLHELAHSMPARFDAIGDILHQRHIMQIYPATAEYTTTPETLNEVFAEVIRMLDAIESALREFVVKADEAGAHPLARQAENLQIENSECYEKILYAWEMYDGDEISPTSYDGWIEELFEED